MNLISGKQISPSLWHSPNNTEGKGLGSNHSRNACQLPEMRVKKIIPDADQKSVRAICEIFCGCLSGFDHRGCGAVVWPLPCDRSMWCSSVSVALRITRFFSAHPAALSTTPGSAGGSHPQRTGLRGAAFAGKAPCICAWSVCTRALSRGSQAA